MSLLLRPALSMGEGPQGFLYRLANANELRIAALKDIGVQFDIEILNKNGYISDELLNGPAGKFAKALAYNLIEKPLAWNRDTVRYCPICLRESEYWHFEWEILFVDTCPDHEVWLHDQCPECRKPLSWNRPLLLKCTCGANLASQKSKSCPQVMTHLSRELKNRVFVSDDGLYLPILGNMDLLQLIRLVRFLGAYGDPLAGPRPQKIEGCSRLEVSWRLTSLAAEILDQWPRSFFDILDRMQKRDTVTGTGKLCSRFGHFYYSLYRAFPESEFDFMRGEFETYIAENWRGAFGKRNRRMYENLPKQMAWIPANHASQQLGLSQRRLSNLVAKGQIQGEERLGKSGRRFLVVSRKDVEIESEKIKNSTDIDLQASARLLGLKKMRLAALLQKFIPEARQLEGKGSPWAIPRKSIDDLLAINQTIAGKLQCSPEEVTMAYVMRYWPWTDGTIAQLLRAVSASSIKPVALLQQTPGIAGWIFIKEQLREWHRLTQQKSMQSLTVPEAATRLAIKQEVAYFLVRKGLLKAELVQKGRIDESRIKSEELEAFSSQYEFGRDLAVTVGTSSRSLVAKLSWLGIRPICGPEIDGCRQILFKRSAELNNAINMLVSHRYQLGKTASMRSVPNENCI